MTDEKEYNTIQLLAYLSEQTGRTISPGTLSDYIRGRRIEISRRNGNANFFNQSGADGMLTILQALPATEVAERMTLRMGRNVSAKTIRDMFRRKVVPTISKPPRLEIRNLILMEAALWKREKIGNTVARKLLVDCQNVTELTRQQIAIICGVRVGTLDQIANDSDGKRRMSCDLYNRINGLIREYSQ